MINIQQTQLELPVVNSNLLELAISTALTRFDRADVDITLRLTNDSEMKVLNEAYRDETKTTDVLSFNEDYTDPETGRYYLGDIVISLEQATKQAESQGHSLDEECAFLTIHGTLHLLGFDHYDPEEKAEMWPIQDKLFTEVMGKFTQNQQ